MRKRKRSKKKKQPVRVTHTHNVIRQVQQEENKEMPAATHNENDKPKTKDKPTVVKSDVGETHPPQVFGGDGVTPIEEWEKHIKELREKQAEHDEKRRRQAVEDAGVIQTTEKYKHDALLKAEERRHAEAQKQEQADLAAKGK